MVEKTNFWKGLAIGAVAATIAIFGYIHRDEIKKKTKEVQSKVKSGLKDIKKLVKKK